MYNFLIKWANQSGVVSDFIVEAESDGDACEQWDFAVGYRFEDSYIVNVIEMDLEDVL